MFKFCFSVFLILIYSFNLTIGWDGDAYKDNSEIQLGWIKPILKDWRGRGDEDILDIGTGDGKIANYLLELVPHGSVTAIDSSESMIQTATKLHPKITFLVMKAEDMVFSQKFHTITSFSCLHWIEDIDSVFRKCHQYLHDTGNVVFYFGIDYNAHRLDHAIEEISKSSLYKEYVSNVKSGFFFVERGLYTRKIGDNRFHKYNN